MSAWALALEGAGVFGAGWTLDAFRHSRKRPKVAQPDPTLATICPACSGDFGKWGATHYVSGGDYRQERACKECGRGQSRPVFRDSTSDWSY